MGGDYLILDPYSGNVIENDENLYINEDGIVDILDIVQTINIAMGFMNPTDIQLCAADVNGDGIVDILDIVMMVNILLGGLP